MDDFVDLIKDLQVKVDKILAQMEPTSHSNKELYKALSEAQSSYYDIEYSGVNGYYKDRYATLSDLVRASRPSLTKNGLCVFQRIIQDDNGTNYLKTVLAHTSGQTVESRIRLSPSKNTISNIGSYLAHMRRITYASLVGIMVHDIDDDDGNLCMQEDMEKVEKGTKPSYTSKDTKSKDFKRISRDQLASLEKSMGAYYDLAENICDSYNIDSLADLPESKYEFVLGQLRKNVAKRDGLL